MAIDIKTDEPVGAWDSLYLGGIKVPSVATLGLENQADLGGQSRRSTFDALPPITMFDLESLE